MRLTVGDVVARYLAEQPLNQDLDAWLWSTVSSLELKVTGDLGYFRIRREPWSTEGDIVLTLALAPDTSCNREVFALAERALFACWDSPVAGEEGVKQALMAGRLAFLRGRLWSAITLARPNSTGEWHHGDSDSALEAWKEVEFPIPINDVDSLMLQPLHVPSDMWPQGYAHAILAAHSAHVGQVSEPSPPGERQSRVRTLESYLGGAAFAWIDGAMLTEDHDAALSMISAAGQALAYAGTFSNPNRERLSEAGRRGSDKRHARTRTLKSWAINQAQTVRGDDMSIARRLSKRIPAELVDASADPVRLIYDAIRDARRRGTSGTS